MSLPRAIWIAALAVLLSLVPAPAHAQESPGGLVLGLNAGLGLAAGDKAGGPDGGLHLQGLFGFRVRKVGFAAHFDLTPAADGMLNLGGEFFLLTEHAYIGLGGGYGSWDGQGFDSCSTCGGGVTGTFRYRLTPWLTAGARGIWQFAFSSGDMNNNFGLFADVGLLFGG